MKTASSSDAGIAALWREFYGPLHDYLRRRMVSDADADDILQEVFLRVHRQISTLHDTSKLQGWVYRITRNALIDHIRARKSQPEASLPGEGIEDSSGPGGDGIDLAQSLRRFVAELPELYREALVRHEFEGQSIRELAHSLGISETAAKSRVRRARLLVRGMLDRCCQFEFDRRGRVIDAVARNGSCLSGSSGERVGCECSSRR